MSIDYFLYELEGGWPTPRELQQHFVNDSTPIRIEGLRSNEWDSALTSYGEEGDIWFSWNDRENRNRIEAIPAYVDLADDDFAVEHTEWIRTLGGSTPVAAEQKYIVFSFRSGPHLNDQLQITAWFVGTLVKHYGAGFLDPQLGRFGAGTEFGNKLLSEASTPGSWLSWA